MLLGALESIAWRCAVDFLLVLSVSKLVNLGRLDVASLYAVYAASPLRSSVYSTPPCADSTESSPIDPSAAQTDHRGSTLHQPHASRSDAGCRFGPSGLRRSRPLGLARHALPALHAEDHAQPAAARRDAGHGLILAPAGVLRHDARRREDPCGVHRWGIVRASEQIKLSRRVSTMHAIDATPARWRGVVVYYRSFQPTWPRTRLTS